MVALARERTLDRMFQRVIVVMQGATDSRDALVLGAQSTHRDGVVIAANVLPSEPAPLDGGPEGAARRRADLRDAGEEVYATLGPDERVRYVTLSGAPLPDAVADLARRERADAIVIGQTALAAGGGRLLADAPCVVLVAPVGYRFRRSGPPARRNGVVKAPTK
jgi:nucleotide-binding universal stress UspA family protein